MRATIGTVAGLAAGLITSLAMAGICLALEHYLGFGFFTLMIWFVVPAGAAITGFLASSGYYLGAKLFDARPNWIMAAGMVAIAGVTQFLIYFGIYATLRLPDGRLLSDVASFWTFVKIYLGHQTYTIGHGGSSGIEVGKVGYAIAAIQFAGFLAGGGFTFLMLKKAAFCEKCARYFRKRFVFSKQGGAEYIDGLRAKTALSDGYFGALQDAQGAGFKLDVSLSECPDCAQQIVSEDVHVLQKKQWKAAPQLSRRLVAENPVLTTFQMLPQVKRPLFGRFRS
jgi:hypothetical protein